MSAPTYEPVLTPVQVERKLLDLSESNMRTYQELRDAEHTFAQAKAEFEVAYSKARLTTHAEHKDWTVGRRDDYATAATEDERLRLAAAEAVVRSARAKAGAVKTQVEIIRSIGTSVRTSMEVGS